MVSELPDGQGQRTQRCCAQHPPDLQQTALISTSLDQLTMLTGKVAQLTTRKTRLKGHAISAKSYNVGGISRNEEQQKCRPAPLIGRYTPAAACIALLLPDPATKNTSCDVAAPCGCLQMV
jgi:hypothetical protein